jgi:hypothetical protein
MHDQLVWWDRRIEHRKDYEVLKYGPKNVCEKCNGNDNLKGSYSRIKKRRTSSSVQI